MRRVLGPEATDEEVAAATREMFASYGRYWAEVFWARPRRKREIVDHTVVENVEAVHAARDSGKGLIFALPHLGNWEAAGARAEDLGVPVLAVAEALSNERIVQWFIETRATFGIDVVIARRGVSVTSQLTDRLTHGGTVALVADRDLSGRGIPVRFFGEETTMPAGPVALAERTGAVLLPVGCYFKSGRGHRFVVHDPLEIPNAGTSRKRVAAGTQRFAEVLEVIIRDDPAQWHLFQPNWPSDRADHTQ